MIVKEQDLTGKNLSNYKITERLGRGGMATVYKAHELSLNRIVALKVLSPRLSEDDAFIKRFHREAQAAAKLNHPGIVQIYAIGEEDGLHYFAMEYIKGTTLADIKKDEGIMDPAHAVSIIKQTAEALGEAHNVGLVHRDVKPSNIMIDATGRPKVTDFGIAYVSEAKTKLTSDGSIIGTPEYLSPEQCEGKTVDARSDIYSLGVTLYEILSGETPYEADTPVSMLVKIIQGTFKPLNEVNPNVPEPLQRVVDKMMQTNPAERFTDMASLSKALTDVEKALTGEAEPLAAVSPQTRPEHIPEAEEEREPEPIATNMESQFQKKKPRRAGPIIAAVLAVFILTGGLLALKIFVFDKQDKTTEPTPAAETVTVAQNEAPPAGEAEPGDPAEDSETPGDTEPPVEMTASDPQSEDTPPAETETTVETTEFTDGEAADPVAKQDPAARTVSPPAKTQAVSPSPKPTRLEATQPQATQSPPTQSKPVQSKPVKPKPVSKPRPAPRTMLVTTMGDENKADLITAFAQEIFSTGGFTVMDGPGLDNRNPAELARHHMTIVSKHMGTETLDFYGNSTQQHTMSLIIRAVDTRTGKVAAGPFTKIVKYTALNAEENLKEAIALLAARIKSTLKQ